jgi:hypothetical protein
MTKLWLIRPRAPVAFAAWVIWIGSLSSLAVIRTMGINKGGADAARSGGSA